MFIYWLMFFIPATASLVFNSSGQGRADINSGFNYNNLIVYFLAFCYALVVGFRFEVGCDWETYLGHFYIASTYYDWQSIAEDAKDMGYGVLNYLAYRSVDAIWGVNIVAALICMFGLARFSLAQPSVALALVVAVPYIVIVLFQGYTRQAVAFGFELFALVALSQSQYKRFVFYILLGATFHKTAVILLPLAALASVKNRLWTYFWVGVTSILAYYFFLAEYQEILWENYVVANYESSGGGIRVAMNALPALLFLLFRNKFNFSSIAERKVWFWISVLSLLCIPLVLQSSTAVDRIALYLMPLQIYVFTRLPSLFEKHKKLITFGVVFYYFLVQFVWLNYASHAHCWVPYKFYFG